MREQDQYLELWQQKRGELPIDTNMLTDWADMQQLLDIQLPVHTPPTSGTQLMHLAKYKLWYALAALITAAAITYVVLQHRTAINNNKPNKTELRTDSSITQADTTANADDIEAQESTLKNDSLINKVLDTAANNSAADDKTANDPSANTTAGPNKNTNDRSADHTGNGGPNLSNSNTNTANKANTISGVKPSATKPAANSGPGSATGVNGSVKPDGRGNYASGIKVIPGSRASRSGNAGANGRLLASSGVLRNGVVTAGGSSNDARTGRNERNGRQGTTNNLNNGRSAQTGNGTARGGRQQKNLAGSDADEAANLLSAGNKRGAGPAFLQLYAPPANLLADDIDAVNGSNAAAMNGRLFKAKPNSFIRMMAPGADKKAKTAKDRTNADPRFDYGLLLGVNAPGSFTPKDQNKNIYGSFSPDIYVGAFGTYNINDRWAIGLQGRALVPYTISGTYSFDHSFQADTVLVKQTLKVSDSRKIYTVDVPVHVIYKVNPNINVKAGPIISIPVKELNGKSSFTMSVDSLKDTTSYYSNVTKSINAASFTKKLRFGISVGVGVTYKFLSFDATYNYYLKPQNVSSALGSYNARANSLQLTIGIKLNKSKK